MHQESYQYQCQITGKVKAYKKMSGQVARALNWTLAERGCYGRWVAQTASGEAGYVAEREQQGPNAELLRPDGPTLVPLIGTRQRAAQYAAGYLKKRRFRQTITLTHGQVEPTTALEGRRLRPASR